ncbi:hypothetical protein M436DRAFT_59957 [Aureobasidium namibiae CBS 147.97]|uniref:Uncharacterized protein n=1 Tax=Aureobasidium namibiae CBS 147.97 TaxID=1043004 RepID=A0A074XTV5_9PEZI|nr:uncharacterized protein M436DRAFT_59957 [Aureobasidium namibiae CBS 147.97]KEQ78016.1 hypothetical protein M436DRAFT_59957 [Aureobasidium namibiae CBS 147.97]
MSGFKPHATVFICQARVFTAEPYTHCSRTRRPVWPLNIACMGPCLLQCRLRSTLEKEIKQSPFPPTRTAILGIASTYYFTCIFCCGAADSHTSALHVTGSGFVPRSRESLYGKYYNARYTNLVWDRDGRMKPLYLQCRSENPTDKETCAQAQNNCQVELVSASITIMHYRYDSQHLCLLEYNARVNNNRPFSTSTNARVHRPSGKHTEC